MANEKILPELEQFSVPIDHLVLDPDNARRHGDRDLRAVADSLSRFGQRRLAIVHRSTRVVKAGNGMIQAARMLGWQRIAAVYVDESDHEAMVYAISDNRTAELSSWDPTVLVAQQALVLAADSLLFTPSELETISQTFNVEETAAPVLQTGDREPFQQMTFTLHDSQVARVKDALRLSKRMGPFDGSPNHNSNGNALARIIEQWVEWKLGEKDEES